MRLALVLLLVPVLFAQAPKRLEFEVASVRPSGPLVATPQTNAAAQLSPQQIRLTYLPLRDLVQRAYEVKAYQVVGPEWTIMDRYDINATLPEGATQADVPAMLRSLLEDRFGLKAHTSQKEFAVYTLERGKRPFTLTKVEPRDTGVNATGVVPRAAGGVSLQLARGAMLIFADNKFEGKGMNMEILSNSMSQFLNQPAINRTGIDGFYDLSLPVQPEDFQIMMATAASKRGVSPDAQTLAYLQSLTPSSFIDALEKVGLKLEKGKAMLDVINIDAANRTPTEN